MTFQITPLKIVFVCFALSYSFSQLARSLSWTCVTNDITSGTHSVWRLNRWPTSAFPPNPI